MIICRGNMTMILICCPDEMVRHEVVSSLYAICGSVGRAKAQWSLISGYNVNIYVILPSPMCISFQYQFCVSQDCHTGNISSVSNE
jgi:hypothetical protein